MPDSRTTPILLVGMFLCSIVVPMGLANSASAAETESIPTAFLESWKLETNNVAICNAASQYDLASDVANNCQRNEKYLLAEDPSQSHDFDDSGNHYYAVTGSSGGIGSSSHGGSSSLHIYKFDINGTFVWREDITTSGSHCSSSSSSQCGVLGLHVVQEDEYYLVMSLYNPSTVTFNSQLSLSLSGWNVVTAYYSGSGWDWAEAESSNSYTSVKDNRLDGDDNLYLTIYDTYSSNYREYSLVAYDANGGKWNRLLEVDRTAEEWILFDTEQSEIHFLINTYNNIRYDSQTSSCPTGSYANHCYVWLTINSNGVKTAATAIKSASMIPLNIEVVGSSLFVHGGSWDEETNLGDGSFNLSGTSQSCTQAADFCTFVSKVDRSASWTGTKVASTADNDDIAALSNIDFNDDGSSVLMSYFISGGASYFDGWYMNQFAARSYEFNFLSLDASFTMRWSTSFASDDLDGIAMYNSKQNMLYFSIESDDPIVVNSSTPLSSSTFALLAWLSLDNGTVVDIEENIFARPIAELSNGGLITRQAGPSNSERIQYYVPDLDNDNIGDDDNCPEVFNPSQDDYNQDGWGDACDTDDDSDGVLDAADSCALGALGWVSSSITDHDADGCKDSLEEDLDDDNDGFSDQKDECPTGVLGAGNDHDADGCKNSEDDDDDDDGINDGSDECDRGEVDWLSGQVTDHDSDGCKDSSEDSDDDNDGVTDIADSCQFGESNWPSNANTDFDGDGCKDGYEDEDDDGDGVLNFEDDCEDSIGTVTADGCPIGESNNDGASNGNNDDNGGTQIYYVCPQGDLVVTDLSECPNSNNSDSNNTVAEPQIYYVCPGGTSVVIDLTLCPITSSSPGGQNITYVLDSNSNLSDEFKLCKEGTAIVMDLQDCPSNSGYQSNDEQPSGSSTSDPMLTFFAGGAFLMAIMAVLLSLFRRPAPVQHYEQSRYDSTELMFKTQPSIPADLSSNSPPISSRGSSRDGYEWIEWPENSNTHWYRTDGTSSEWAKYQE